MWYAPVMTTHTPLQDPDTVPEPDCTDFMDDDMRQLWNRMNQIPDELRLYGGTALALYRNHRASTYFDFAATEPVINFEYLSQFDWLHGARLRGGDGMIDATVTGKSRDITVTFMECGCLIPFPKRSPIMASNGVSVVHPVDLIASKIAACLSREKERDYIDIAEAVRVWPQWCQEAARGLDNYELAAISRSLAAPPYSIYEKVDRSTLALVRTFSVELVQLDKGLDFGFD